MLDLIVARMASDMASSDTEAEDVVEVAETIAEETALSHKQATAYLMRHVLGRKDKIIAEVLDVAPTSSSSYISAVNSKFDSVDEEIEELKEEIDKWKKTEHLQSILNETVTKDSDAGLQYLSERVNRELVEDEDTVYLTRYVDENGEEQVIVLDVHPHNNNDETKEILDYKRIGSVDELFE